MSTFLLERQEYSPALFLFPSNHLRYAEYHAMINIDNAPVFGRVAGESGIVIAGMPVFGTTNKPDYSPIDLTTEKLDERIRFMCASSHACYDKNGLIYYAGPDECPVEYINGVAVGRHEPEAQSTNYLRFSGAYYTAYRCYYQYNRPSPDGLNTAVNIITTTVNNGASFCDVDSLVGIECTTSIIAKHVSGACNWVFKQEGSSASDIIFTPAEKAFNRKSRTFTPILYSGHVRMSLLNYGTLAVEDTACSFHRQMEQGKIATSPIKESTVFTTRGASFLLVEMQGAAGIRVRYTTGDYDEYPANGEEWFPLPWSKKNWGTRYIPTIEYIQ
ncbi:hypothetical protein LPW36_02050 [Jinshanibacter sp. LJY008]|uniref:Uncharacterized protein n=1 Tax=Limnobaculum eriocheiris TaxID=2897391 RepID=A0A9X1MW51_9GAMM|nr:hypothetical protein [Limnobaculum eriocheiris]MCD1124827.1 hypothetical protein [Limnobaculum eriocheiris]